MESKWTLEVTESYIIDGSNKNPELWAIALALRDKGIEYVRVFMRSIFISRGEYELNIDEYTDEHGNNFYGTFFVNHEKLRDWQKDLIDGLLDDPITLEFDEDYKTVSIL